MPSFIQRSRNSLAFSASCSWHSTTISSWTNSTGTNEGISALRSCISASASLAPSAPVPWIGELNQSLTLLKRLRRLPAMVRVGASSDLSSADHPNLCHCARPGYLSLKVLSISEDLASLHSTPYLFLAVACSFLDPMP